GSVENASVGIKVCKGAGSESVAVERVSTMAKARTKVSVNMAEEDLEDAEDVEVISAAAEEQATLLEVERLLSEVESMPEEERPSSLTLLGPGERKALVTPSL